MKIRTTLAIALALGATVGCNKKDKDKANPDPGGMTKTNEGTGTTTTPPPDTTKKPPPPEPVKPAPLAGADLAKKYQDCVAFVNGGKIDDFKKTCVSGDFKGHQMDGAEVPNVDAIVGYFAAMKTGFPDWKLEPQLVIVSGRNILAVELASGTNTADWKSPDGHDMKKTDKKVGYLFFHRLAINDENKATEEWVYADPTTMMGQLGLLPKEAPPVRPALDKGWPGAPIVVVSADDAKEKTSLEGVKKGADTFNSHKLADIMGTWTDDGLESDQADGKDAKGKKEIEASTKMFFGAFPDVKVEATNRWAAGDYVVELGTFTGKNTGAMGPMKATNKEVKGSYAEIMKLKDGKVSEIWRFRNGFAMAMQLGLVKDPAMKKDEPTEPKKDAPKKAAPKKDAPKADKKT